VDTPDEGWVSSARAVRLRIYRTQALRGIASGDYHLSIRLDI
jgi:hypothetical protein